MGNQKRPETLAQGLARVGKEIAAALDDQDEAEDIERKADSLLQQPGDK